MTLRMPNKHFWRRCRGRLITNKEWIRNFETSLASLIWLRLSILSYSFTPVFFYFDYFMQGNVWIEDIFHEILLTIPKHYSEKQEPSLRRDRQHFSTKLHPIKKITEVSPETRSYGEQIDPRVLSSHYGQYPHWTCCRDRRQLWAQSWAHQHGAIQPVLWEGTRRC